MRLQATPDQRAFLRVASRQIIEFNEKLAAMSAALDGLVDFVNLAIVEAEMSDGSFERMEAAMEVLRGFDFAKLEPTMERLCAIIPGILNLEPKT